MENRKEITAGIIIIGNEVLSGRTKDINTSTLAKWLNSIGIEVKEVRVIPDTESTIIDTVNHLRKNLIIFLQLVVSVQPMMILRLNLYRKHLI